MRKLMLLACLLAGCATTQRYGDRANEWVGHKGSVLVTSWGVPQKSMKLPNGENVYEYADSTDTTTQCRTWFVSDQKDIIKSVRFEGLCFAH